jgi:hypothetical protein
MIENQKIRPAQVIGPLGEPLTIESLPPANTRRWVVRRKAEVVAAVNGGLLTIDEVLERYDLTLEEFASWQRAVDRSGMQGSVKEFSLPGLVIAIAGAAILLAIVNLVQRGRVR